jgi:hypothetical protein
MANTSGLPLGKIGSKSINAFTPKTGTPVNAVAAQGTLTIAAQPTANDTMTIGSTVYTFKASGSATTAGTISVGTDLATAKAAIIAAIKGTDSVNTAHPTVGCGSSFSTNDLTLTALTKGEAGNNIATTETFTNAGNVFDAATLGTTTEGVNGTVAAKLGMCYIDNSYIYYNINTNTISDTYWRRISLGSAY